jgi:hypothetical protein
MVTILNEVDQLRAKLMQLKEIANQAIQGYYSPHPAASREEEI